MSVPTAEIQTFLSSLQNVIGEFAKTLEAEPKRKKIVKKKASKTKVVKEETEPKKRGRPAKTKVENEVDVVDVAKTLVEMSQKSAPKKRGRPTKPENVGKPKPQRKAPQASAKDFQVGDSMTGLDGFVWIVAQRAKTGGLYWKKAFLVENK